MPPVLPDLPALLVRRVPRAPPGLLVLPDPLAQRVPPDLPALPGQPVLLDLLGLPVQLERRVPPALRAPPERFIKESQLSVKMRFLVKPPRYGY